MPIYSYECACGRLFEELKPSSKRQRAKCSCGLTAKLIITRVSLDPNMGLDPAFTTSSDRWAKVHEQRARKEYDRA